MAIFSGNIIEAYYANENNDTVEVIYKQGEKAINHYLKVDFNNQDFKDLIAEYDTDRIAGSTIARNRNYARQLSELVNAGIQSRTDKNEKVKVTIDEFIDTIINFDNKNEQCNEILFALKVKLFENDIVKNSTDKDTKSLLRSAKTPVEAIKLFDKLNG